MQLFWYQDQEDTSRSLPTDPGLNLLAFVHAQELECLQRHLDIVDQSGSKRIWEEIKSCQDVEFSIELTNFQKELVQFNDL